MDEIKFTEEQLESLSKKELVQLVLMLSKQIDNLSRQIENLTEQIRIMNSRTYGRKTEKTSTIIEMPQLEFELNEAEAVHDTEEAAEPELEEVTR